MTPDDPGTGLDFHSVTIRWPNDAVGPWLVTVWSDLHDGMPRCVGIEVKSFKDITGDGDLDPAYEPRELTAAGLRAVPLGLMVRRAHSQAADAYARAAEAVPDRAAELLAVSARFDAAGPPRRYGAEHWREVAAVYSEAANRGAPTEAVRRHFHLSKSAAAKQVARCREMGLLPPTSRGRIEGGVDENPTWRDS